MSCGFRTDSNIIILFVVSSTGTICEKAQRKELKWVMIMRGRVESLLVIHV